MIIAQPNELAGFISGLKLKQRLPLVIGLIGDLGAGKTTLVKYILADLGISQVATSPTYNIQNIYQNDQYQVEHWDLYRLKHLPEELAEPVLLNTLRIVEWINLVPNYQDLIDLEIRIEILSETKRQFTLVEY